MNQPMALSSESSNSFSSSNNNVFVSSENSRPRSNGGGFNIAVNQGDVEEIRNRIYQGIMIERQQENQRERLQPEQQQANRVEL